MVVFFESLLAITLFILLYAYVGYLPLLKMLALVQPRGTKRHTTATNLPPINFPSITIIIPVYNEEKSVAAKVENTLSLSYPHSSKEIIFIDDGSNDDSAKILHHLQEQHKNTFKLFLQPTNMGKYRAICDGVKLASNRIIVLSDCSAVLDKMALQELAQAFNEPKVGAASGHYQIPVHQHESSITNAESAYFRYENKLKKFEQLSGSIVVVQGALYAFRKELFLPMPKKIINDDIYIPCQILRQGYDVAFAPNAIVYESNRVKEKQEFFKRIRIATGNIQCLWDHRSLLLPTRYGPTAMKLITHKLLRLLSPLLLIIIYISTLMLTSITNSLLAITIAYLVHTFYLLAFIGFMVNKFEWRSLPIFNRPYYFVLCNLAILCALIKFPFQGHRVFWSYSMEKSKQRGL